VTISKGNVYLSPSNKLWKVIRVENDQVIVQMLTFDRKGTGSVAQFPQKTVEGMILQD